MISKETALRIWTCFAEIEAGEKMLDILKKATQDGELPDLRDSWGRRRHLRLGVLSGENSTTLFDVDEKLGAAVVEAHIANKRQELVAINQQALVEAKAP